MTMFRCAYAWTFYITVPLYLALLAYKYWWQAAPVYRYSLAGYAMRHSLATSSMHRVVLAMLRGMLLATLVLLVARPQIVDEVRDVQIDGVDIMLVIDVSESMREGVQQGSRLSRIDAAKREALHFIEKRKDDAIGVVLFGKNVITQCPLTLDQQLLSSTIASIQLGYIDSDGTSLFSGLANACSRLANSQASSKVVIILTDGVPVGDQVDEQTAISIAKKLGVKVYTIGIGSYVRDMYGRVIDSIDMSLLARIAQETGGAAFRADNAAELRTIYDKIDALEKTTRSVTMYQRKSEACWFFLWFAMLCALAELGLRLTIWRRLWW